VTSTAPTADPAAAPTAASALTFLRLSTATAGAWLAARPDALLLDGREARDHAASHLAGCLRLDGRNHEPLLMREPKDRPVFVYCYHGNASRTWASMFIDFGFRQVADLIGGWAAVDPTGQRAGAQSQAELFGAARADAAAPAAFAVPPELAAWLTAEGFDPTRPDAPAQHGNTPLMHAAWRGAHRMVDALLSLKVPRDATNGDGNNALWLACVNGEPGLIRGLAASGVPIDHLNLTGATALMYAASSGKAEVVATLLALGADPQLVTQDDYSAMDMAASIECLQLLRAATRRAA
jgi:rhodanese-related sulfurtransferase